MNKKGLMGIPLKEVIFLVLGIVIGLIISMAYIYGKYGVTLWV